MPERIDVAPGSPEWTAARPAGATVAQLLHDDYGDAITIHADVSGPPALLVTFWAGPFSEGSDAFTCMRLSGGRLAAFTEAIGRHAAHLAALASGGAGDDLRRLLG